MARKLDPSEVPPLVFKTHATQDPYPWHVWIDGDVWELEQGVDFHEKIQRFRERCYRKAAGFEMRLRSRIRGNKILVQFWLP